MCLPFLHRLRPIHTLLIALLLHQQVQAATDRSVSETIDAPIIFIGHKPTNHYVIVIPSPQDDQIRSQLTRIRDKIAPIDQIPFMTRNHLGRYIYVASFTDRNQAETIRQQFLKDESRARVVYFPQ